MYSHFEWPDLVHIGFLSHWSQASGSFFLKINISPLNLQKWPLKTGIFNIFAIWVSGFGFFGLLDREFRVPVYEKLALHAYVFKNLLPL